MINFCTLFDSNYLSRGIALYESLYRYCSDFHLYFFAFDDKCRQVLHKLALDKTTIISLREFEDEELLAAKSTRSCMEYCWTCTPTTIRYAMDKYDLESCTYLDADLYFWASPEPLLDEIGDNSVMITEHRYTPCYDQSLKSGKYCVQFMTFKNDQRGKNVLNWWRNACNNWCYARHEDGKFGDQKYLDDWLERFKGIHAQQHLGGGVAPWNVQQYDIFENGNKLFGTLKSTAVEFPLVFYHFHHLKFYNNGRIDLGGYRLSNNIKTLLYKPYIRHLEKLRTTIQQIDNSIYTHGQTALSFKSWKNPLRYAKHKLVSNVISKAKFVAD